ncbi:MAG: hypothetical protein HQK93_10475 [Nitrospirae bacterium]|nr:hypothetical protein [Nitrospirota bacterium]
MHSTNERLRLRLPNLKNNLESLADLKTALLDIEGINNIEINPKTSSVLILHSNAKEQILSAAIMRGLLKIKEKKTVKTTATPFTANVTETARTINSKLKALTGREIDLPNMFFLVLFGTGVYQVARGNFALPAWYTAFWYAYGVFIKGMPK